MSAVRSLASLVGSGVIQRRHVDRPPTPARTIITVTPPADVLPLPASSRYARTAPVLNDVASAILANYRKIV
jgi:hypothetical protein